MITNYLSPTSFVVSIKRLPNIEFYTQRVTLPNISGGQIDVSTPLNPFYTPQTGLDYSPLEFGFIVDENMRNYLEIFNWLQGVTAPQSSELYKAIANSEDGLESDISILVSNSHKNPNVQFTFYDCFPTDLSSINLDITAQDINYSECTVTFRYTYFSVDNI